MGYLRLLCGPEAPPGSVLGACPALSLLRFVLLSLLPPGSACSRRLPSTLFRFARPQLRCLPSCPSSWGLPSSLPTTSTTSAVLPRALPRPLQVPPPPQSLLALSREPPAPSLPPLAPFRRPRLRLRSRPRTPPPSRSPTSHPASPPHPLSQRRRPSLPE